MASGKGFDWNDLRHFLAAAKHGSLSGAAREVGVSVATVGRRLDALEAALGVSLVERSPEGLVLTVQGRALLVHARDVEGRVGEMTQSLSGDVDEVSGEVRVVTRASLAAEILAPHLHRMLLRHPGLHLDLVSSAFEEEFREENKEEILLGFGRPRGEGWVCRRVATVGFGVYASEAYVARRGFVARPRQSLSGHQIVAYPHTQDRAPEMAWLHTRAQDAEVVMRATSLRVLREAILWGAGVGVLPSYMASSGLQQLVAPQHLPKRAVWLCVHRERQHVPRWKAVSEFLVDTLETLLGAGPM